MKKIRKILDNHLYKIDRWGKKYYCGIIDTDEQFESIAKEIEQEIDKAIELTIKIGYPEMINDFANYFNLRKSTVDQIKQEVKQQLNK